MNIDFNFDLNPKSDFYNFGNAIDCISTIIHNIKSMNNENINSAINDTIQSLNKLNDETRFMTRGSERLFDFDKKQLVELVNNELNVINKLIELLKNENTDKSECLFEIDALINILELTVYDIKQIEYSNK